ncbi:NB-ARC domain-containing protein [Streptomyces bingchenggensis BCW-1]|uniref:NB-ARC domain-containing protein n=1 Tax=Streptomyces bingchenggensis (strain BCW-1) TaxID=749414 RepID=D7BT28_STRBB|nr:NB-ARC domain-containing protein [Streptomyces bingchenggensis BCW-1]
MREALRTGRPCRGWLLVFDNAEELDTVRPFFPSGGPGRILVTSRNAQWSRAARRVEVDVSAEAARPRLTTARPHDLPYHRPPPCDGRDSRASRGVR